MHKVLLENLIFFLGCNASPEVGVLSVELGAMFLSDHYPVRLHLCTLPGLPAPGNSLARACFKMGSGVS